MNLQDKIVLVTGGAQGIGKEIALTLADAGAHVAVCDVNETSLDSTVSEIKKKGRDALGMKANVTNVKDVEEVIRKILDKYQRIDILVNNAGITRDNLLVRMSEEDWDLVLSVNLKGVFLFSKAVARPMMKQRAGCIINIASIIGIMGNAGQANYAASKGGVIALTKTMAKELAKRNITVNAIAPGFIKTAMTDKLTDEVKSEMMKMIPLGRLGEPKDVARVVLFLASENASYITGQVITIDGGMVM
ncbi:MAG: 3-oxoacyl-[acyl-carrier-protein] reductase [Candidatus Omnitrophica bacterium]|nr:3-oxoacyl-[acyl-carrier-protein] reductase [Candidatus Omnitrophota bacterium]